jgi:signal transduction histidine kinase
VNYAKPSANQAVPCCINEVARQAVSFCEHTLRGAGARLDDQLAPSVPLVYGVRDQLIQVFINLITNACHALDQKGGTVTMRSRDLGSGAVEVDVVDTGNGISKEHLPRVFEPFFSTKGPGQGTGLGLSIVKNIVDGHHGSIEIRSALGCGTVVHVVLPTERFSART